MRRALSAIAIAAIATAAALVPIQVAAAERDEAQLTRLAMIDAMRDQLAAMGVNPALAVVQTGIRNYAGPNCPGADWNCTDGTIAIQLGIANQFECTGDLTPGDECVIMQTTSPPVPTSPSGNNYARCVIHSSGPDQVCTIEQTNFGTGDNHAYVEMLLVQDMGPEQIATQKATVIQRNNGSLNASHISQTIQQIVREVKQEPNEDLQTQNATQTADVCQGGPGSPAVCPSVPTPAPGANHSVLHQLVSQDAFANFDGPTNQTQISDITDTVTQADSVTDPGRSHSEANVSEHQVMHAKVPGFQSQSGPVRCCSSQTGDPNNSASVNESSNQQSDGGGQFSSITGTCNTSGSCTVSQVASNNGAHSTNHQSGNLVNTTTVCFSGEGSSCGPGD